MPRRKKASWARQDRPKEANLVGSMYYVNDQIWQAGNPEKLQHSRRKEVEEWLRESGQHSQGGVHLINTGFWVNASRNDPLDPLCVAFVVEMLMRLNWDAYITSHDLTPLLQRYYPQISWDNFVVGRILGMLGTACAGMDMPNDQVPPHIVTVRTKGLNQYALSISEHTWDYLRAVRNAMRPIARRRIPYLRSDPETRRTQLDPREDVGEAIAGIGYAGLPVD